MKDKDLARPHHHYNVLAEALLSEVDMHNLRMRGLLQAFGQPAEDGSAAHAPLGPTTAPDHAEAGLPSPGSPKEDADASVLLPAGSSLVRRRMEACRRAAGHQLQTDDASGEIIRQNHMRCRPLVVAGLDLKNSDDSSDDDSSGESSVESKRPAPNDFGSLRKAACEANPATPVVTLAVPSGPFSSTGSAVSTRGSLRSATSSRRGSCQPYDSGLPTLLPSFPQRPSMSTSASSESETPSSEEGVPDPSASMSSAVSPANKRSSKNSMQQTAIFRRLSAVGIESLGEDGEEGAGTPTVRSRTKKFVTSVSFDVMMGMMVITNAVTIGIQVDHAGMNVGDDPPQHYEDIETVFCVVFASELAIRIYALRSEFLAKFGWNYFDTLLVTLQVTEELAKIAGRTTGSSSIARNVKIMKVWRLLRLFRSMRLIRIVRFVDELSKLVNLVVCSFWSFLWTMLLLLILTYIAGSFITQIVADHGEHTPSHVESQLRTHFGRLGSTVFALFESILGGVDWKDLVDPLFHISVALPPFFALYIAFVVLVLLNLVTGVFVETAQRKRDIDTQDQLEQKLKRALKKADLRLDALISLADFKALLAQEEMVAYLKGHNMDEASMMSVFKLLFDKHRGCITPQEFLTFCLRLEGMGASIELGKLHLQTSNDLQEMQLKGSRDRAADRKAMQKFFNQSVVERKQLRICCEELREMQPRGTHSGQELKNVARHGARERKALRVLHEQSREAIEGHLAELRESHEEAARERADLDHRVSELAGLLMVSRTDLGVAPAHGGGGASQGRVAPMRGSLWTPPRPEKVQLSLQDAEQVGTEAPG